MKFKGDIIITDPCYIIDDNNNNNLWDEMLLEYYKHLPKVNGYDKYEINDMLGEIILQRQNIGLIKESCDDFMIAIKDATIEKDIETYRKLILKYCEKLQNEKQKFYKNKEILKQIKNDKFYIKNKNKMRLSKNFLNKFGFTDCMMGDTLYGDWSCTTYNTDTKETIGKFCADVGMYGIFYLDEVLKFNPNFDLHINKKYTTTLIENFDGYIEIKVNKVLRQYTQQDGKLKKYFDKEIEIHGTGNINFFTTQTGT